MRLACAWPLLIGLRTLDLLAAVAQLARSRRHPQGAPRARLRAHGPVARHGLVHARPRPPGPPPARAHPPVSRAVPIIQARRLHRRGPSRGNPAAAVLDADGLDEAAMQADRRARCASPGTAFVSASTRAGRGLAAAHVHADARGRLLRPHRRSAASHALIEAGRLPRRRASSSTTAAGAPARSTWSATRGGCSSGSSRRCPRCRPFDRRRWSRSSTRSACPGRGAGWARPAVTPDARPPPPGRATSPRCGRSSRTWRRLAAVRATQRGAAACCLRLARDGGARLARATAASSRPHFGIPRTSSPGSVHSSLGVWLLEAGLAARATARSPPSPPSRATGSAAPGGCRWSSPCRTGAPRACASAAARSPC